MNCLAIALMSAMAFSVGGRGSERVLSGGVARGSGGEALIRFSDRELPCPVNIQFIYLFFVLLQ